nr:MAG TPA: hypothetical protein [Bacteriophage sp.]
MNLQRGEIKDDCSERHPCKSCTLSAWSIYRPRSRNL